MTTIRIESRMDTMIRDAKNYCSGFGAGFCIGVLTLACGLILSKAKEKEKIFEKGESKEEES